MLTPLQLPQTTFDLRAILQKRDNLRATSDKMKCEITASQDFELKKVLRQIFGWLGQLPKRVRKVIVLYFYTVFLTIPLWV